MPLQGGANPGKRLNSGEPFNRNDPKEPVMTPIASTLRNLLAASALLGLASLAAHAATDTPSADAPATVETLSVDEPTTTEALRADPLELTSRPVPTCRPRHC